MLYLYSNSEIKDIQQQKNVRQTDRQTYISTCPAKKIRREPIPSSRKNKNKIWQNYFLSKMKRNDHHFHIPAAQDGSLQMALKVFNTDNTQVCEQMKPLKGWKDK